jgi:Holliday junction resolvase RusA-like endonuclease
MLLFEIHIPPVPQKQTRVVQNNGFFRHYDPSGKDREKIEWQIKANAPAEPYTCPLMVELTFYLPIPKATSMVKRRQMLNNIILPMKRPDIDNLGYLVTNAMKTIIYADDSQIVDLYMHKRYGEDPRTIVKIIPIYNAEQTRADECGT